MFCALCKNRFDMFVFIFVWAFWKHLKKMCIAKSILFLVGWWVNTISFYWCTSDRPLNPSPFARKDPVRRSSAHGMQLLHARCYIGHDFIAQKINLTSRATTLFTTTTTTLYGGFNFFIFTAAAAGFIIQIGHLSPSLTALVIHL